MRTSQHSPSVGVPCHHTAGLTSALEFWSLTRPPRSSRTGLVSHPDPKWNCVLRPNLNNLDSSRADNTDVLEMFHKDKDAYL